MRRSTFVWVLLLIIAGFSASYSATTGAISGQVKDTRGQPLAGVSIIVSSPNLIGSMEALTDEEGRYTIFFLPPGEYDVKAEAQGMKTVIQRNLRVVVNETTRADFTMEMTPTEVSIEVTADAPIVDTTKTTIANTVDRTFTERLPNSDTFQAAFSLGGGVVGGGNPKVHGSSNTENLYLFDGVDTTDPLTSTFGANLNSDVVEMVEVQTAGYMPEYGRAMGGIVNAITKSGSNSFEGIARLKFVNSDWNASPKHEGQGGKEKYDRMEPQATFGGPIVKDRLWFYIGYEYTDIDLKGEAPIGVNPDTGKWIYGDIDRSRVSENYFAKLTFRINDKNRIFLEWISDPAVIHGISEPTYSPSAQEKQLQGGNVFSLEWTSNVGANSIFNFKTGIHEAYLDVIPEDEDKTTPAHFNQTDQIWYDNAPYWSEEDRNRYSFSSSLTHLVPGWYGVHTFKFGVEYQHLLLRDYMFRTGGVTYTDRRDENGNIVKYQKSIDIGKTEAENTGNYYAVYVQDSWKLKDNFTINGGFRYEYMVFKNDVGEEAGKFDMMIAPRIGFSWDPFKTGRSKTIFHYGRYYNPLDLQIPNFLNRKSQRTEVWQYGPMHPGADEEGYYFLYSVGGEENPNRIDPNLHPEHTDEFSLGYEQEIFDNVSLGVTAILKRTRNIVEDRGLYYDKNWNPISDPYSEDLYYLVYEISNPAGAKRDYRGIEFTLKANTKHFDVLSSFTLSSSKGSVINNQPGMPDTTTTHFSVYYDLPGTSTNLYGPLPWDSRYYLKVNLVYHAPWGFHIGTNSFIREGYPYSKLGSDPLYGTGATLPEGRGKHRLPQVEMVNISVQKDFSFGKWGTLTLIADVENVFDNQVVLSKNEYEGERFGIANDWASPRTVSFSVKYAF